MMIATLALALAAAGPATVQHQVEHRGARHDVSYHPHVTTEAKTIGMSVGARPSTQRCLWTTRVAVERRIANPTSGGSAAILAPVRLIRDSRHGDCTLAAHAIETAAADHADKVRAHVEQVAAADRAAALAAIDAAQTLALN